MLSTNTDYSQIETNSRDTEALDVETPTSTKRTLRDCEHDMLGSSTTSSLLSVASSLNKAYTISVMSAHQQILSSNVLTKLQGQKWQQYFDFEKVLKQMRCAEKAQLKISDMEHHAGSSNSSSGKSSSFSPSVALSQKPKYSPQKQKQVQRLSGSDMQYYGLAPKQKALEIVICNVCKGIYTKVGFNNHMLLQHAAIWSTVSTKTCAKTEEPITNSLPDSREEQLRDLERIELVGISSDSSATASSTMSSSSSSQASSSFGSSTRAAKGNRSSNSSASSNGRSRCKISKTQHLPTSTSTLSVQNSPQQIASPTVAQLLLSSSSNSKSSSSAKLSSTTTLPTTPITTAAVQANVTVKMLPTFGNASVTHSNSTPPSVLGISGSFSNSSNSSTSSSSMSSTSSKSSSQSKTSSPSITFPTLLSLPLADASNNATAQFEIVSSSTPYYVGSTGKGRKNANFSIDSFEKTDDNATITSISDLRVLTSVASDATPKFVSTTNPEVLQTPDMDSDQKLNNMTLGSLIPTPHIAEEENYQQLPVSTNNRINNEDVCSTSESIISSTVDILQPTPIMTQHDYGLNNMNCNIERLQMSIVSTSCMSPTLTLAKSNPYAKMATTMVTPNCSGSKLSFDQICGVSASDEFGITPCTRPLTCSVHSHASKRQVPGRSKPFDELLAYYCAGKEGKATFLGQDIDSINSSCSANFERRSVFGTLVAVPNIPTTTEPVMENDSFSSNISTLKFMKPIPEKTINYMNSQDRSEFEARMPLYSTSHSAAHDKSKLDTIHATVTNSNKYSILSMPSAATSSNLSQVQLDSVEQSCDERVQNNHNSSDDNSILTLEGIFDHNTQLEMLDSKFITEILNTAESDINFDELEGSSSTATVTMQTRLPQPATKRLRIEDSAIQQTAEIEKHSAFPSFEQQQLQTYVSEQSAIMNQSIELKNSNVYDGNDQEQDKKQIEIQYQTELNNVLQQQQQEQITAIEAMQFQQLLYQQCSFNNVDDNILEQEHQKQQVQQQSDNISKEVIDLSVEDEGLKTDNMSKILTLDGYTTDIKRKDPTSFSECDVDEDSCEEMEWNFNVINVPSLTDENNEEITIDSLVEFTTSSQQDGTEQYGLPTEDDLLFEIPADNPVSMQQKQVIAELLTQRDYKAVANLHFNNSHKSNMCSMNENRDHNNEDPHKSAFLSFDFSLIESQKSLTSSRNGLESKCKISQKQSFDELNLNIQMFNSVPRPLTINHFGLIKFPLSLATAFRRDLLTSRKANNNPITLTGSGSSVLGNYINGCVIGGNAMNARFSSGNATKNISNVASLNSSGSVGTNLLNEFAIGNILVSNSTNSFLSKQQRNGNVDLIQTSVPSSSNNIASSSNGTMTGQGNTLHRLQKSMLNNTLNSYPCANGKSKTAINSTAPIAIVNPTARLSVTAQINQNNINTYSNNGSSFVKNVQTASNNSNNALDTDRIKLVKRSPITKLNTLKSTFFTPKIITELLMGSGSLTANFIGVPNGNCDNAVKSHTIKYYRNKSLYAKRRIYKLSQQQRAGITNSTLNIAREKKHKTLQAILP